MKTKTKFSIQKHYQKKKRSVHYDIRILGDRSKKLYSWALPKMKFPRIGQRVLAIRTVDHPVDYMYFEGRLKNGDVVTVVDRGECDVLVNTKKVIVFDFKGKVINGVYNFINVDTTKDTWIITKSRKNYESKTK